MTVKEETLRLTLRQREGRAINAVAELLRRTLSVPNIYLEPPASLISADILAVDRGGAGDLHAVEIKLPEKGPAPVSPSAKETSTAALLEKSSQDDHAGRSSSVDVYTGTFSLPRNSSGKF